MHSALVSPASVASKKNLIEKAEVLAFGQQLLQSVSKLNSDEGYQSYLLGFG
jgi:hypothetical protein